MTEIPDLTPAIDLIKKFEGCVLHTYLDVVKVPTIGYGHTGPDVHSGQHITQAQAEELLHSDLGHFAAHVAAVVTVPCSRNEFCALVSFSYNVGIGALRGSRLLAMLNARDTAETVSNEFLHWVYAGHVIYSGLVRRRKEERELFLTPDSEPLAA